MSAVANRAVSVVPLGRMGFMAAYDVQMRYVRKHLDELAGKPHVEGENALLLVEHTPVYTVGTREKDYSADYEKTLKSTGAEFYRTNRGGLVTFHGPGQLVAYPILNLKHFKPSMKWYVCQLEETLIGTLRRFGISGRRTDQTGVWVDDRKIASIGLHGRRFITSHGVALNVDPDLEWFSKIEACGLPGVDMTSISRELDRQLIYRDAVKPFLRTFQEVFDCELEYKMLEEQEFNSMSVPTPTGHRHSATSDLKEVGLRHMSTQAGGGGSVTQQQQYGEGSDYQKQKKGGHKQTLTSGGHDGRSRSSDQQVEPLPQQRGELLFRPTRPTTRGQSSDESGTKQRRLMMW